MGQFEHDEAPAAAYDPTAQLSQLLDPTDPAYLPAAQFAQFTETAVPVKAK